MYLQWGFVHAGCVAGERTLDLQHEQVCLYVPLERGGGGGRPGVCWASACAWRLCLSACARTSLHGVFLPMPMTNLCMCNPLPVAMGWNQVRFPVLTNFASIWTFFSSQTWLDGISPFDQASSEFCVPYNLGMSSSSAKIGAVFCNLFTKTHETSLDSFVCAQVSWRRHCTTPQRRFGCRALSLKGRVQRTTVT